MVRATGENESVTAIAVRNVMYRKTFKTGNAERSDRGALQSISCRIRRFRRRRRGRAARRGSPDPDDVGGPIPAGNGATLRPGRKTTLSAGNPASRAPPPISRASAPTQTRRSTRPRRTARAPVPARPRRRVEHFAEHRDPMASGSRGARGRRRPTGTAPGALYEVDDARPGSGAEDSPRRSRREVPSAAETLGRRKTPGERDRGGGAERVADLVASRAGAAHAAPCRPASGG
jgi:hypothetical protein